jgi:hypothetical protein
VAGPKWKNEQSSCFLFSRNDFDDEFESTLIQISIQFCPTMILFRE